MLRVGIIGLGGMGRGRLRYYAQIPEARVEAIADVRAEELKQDAALAALLSGPVRWFEDYRQLIASGIVDMVDICLPTGRHKDATVVALEAGLHVLCEKPMALTLSDCDAMLEAQRRSGRSLMIAQCIRFWPEYQLLADWVQSGEAGALLALQLARMGPLPGAGRTWLCQAERSGGAILDLHIHDIDYCQYLLGLPRRVYAQGGAGLGEPCGINYVLTNLDYGGGLQVSAAAQWANVRMPFLARYEAHFERAFLRFDSSRAPTLAIYRQGMEPEYPAFTGDAYLNEIRYFVDCVAAGATPERCPPRQARDSVALIMGAKAAIERRGFVDMAEFAR